MGIPATKFRSFSDSAFLVGGAVRDLQLNVKPKDFDFTVEDESFAGMRDAISKFADNIFLEKEEFGTIRANVHRDFIEQYVNLDHSNRTWLAADFVLARKDGYYSDGRRPDSVAAGLLEDDLRRRDFTINAMALDNSGKLIDLFGGRNDIKRGMVRTVGDPTERFTEDALRVVRALRFAVTKDMWIETRTASAMQSYPVIDALRENIAVERIQQELLRMFQFDTIATLNMLDQFPLLRIVLLGKNTKLWLKPTLEEK